MSDRYKYASWEWEAIGDAWEIESLKNRGFRFEEDNEYGWVLRYPKGGIFYPYKKVKYPENLLSVWYTDDEESLDEEGDPRDASSLQAFGYSFRENSESGWVLVFPLGSVFRPPKKVDSVQALLDAWYSAE